MRPGPAPRPTSLKRAQGNPGRRPLNAREPAPRRGRPAMPAWLSPLAKQEWRRVTKQLMALRVLSNTDGTALAAYCETYADYVGYTLTLREEGATMTTTHGNVIQHPLLGAKHTCLKILRALLCEFGLTPASRSRVEIGRDENDRGDAQHWLFGAS